MTRAALPHVPASKHPFTRPFARLEREDPEQATHRCSVERPARPKQLGAEITHLPGGE